MRKLLYVPIIHGESDLGSLGPAIDRTSASLVGHKRWAEHKQTISRFWQSVADYLLSLDAAGLKIYQDGLVADGELGMRVVEEAARRGSRNHQIILSLMEKGAEIRRTEDASLLLQEHQSLSRLASGQPPEMTSIDLKGQSERLAAERDRFIAKTIDESLGEGETAVLFIGAYHSVLSYLAPDIVVQQVKEVEKVRAYFRQLLSRRDEARLKQLAHYLTSPIPTSLS